MYPFPYNDSQNKSEEVLFSGFNLNNLLDQNKHTNFILDLYQIKSYSSCKKRGPKTKQTGFWAKRRVLLNQKEHSVLINSDNFIVRSHFWFVKQKVKK